MSNELKIEAPGQLSCELLTAPQLTEILTASPKLGWSIPVGQMQRAYQVIVASAPGMLCPEKADLWNTGKVGGYNSINIKYQGWGLRSGCEYYWQVRFWNSSDDFSDWSEVQKFVTGEFSDSHSTTRYPLEVHEIAPQKVERKAPGHYFYDFGKASFGTVEFIATSRSDGHVIDVHLGEDVSAPATIDREPKGNIRYRKMSVKLKKGTHRYKVKVTPDIRNSTERRAIKMPACVGEVMPFRYCELQNLPDDVSTSELKQLAVYYHFDDSASEFESSNEVLNQVWDLCKYSIKATSFCGIYVDGDRERIPYEGDAFINQLSHYGVDREYSLARYTHEYLVHHPTWTVEWILSSVLMAWADYMYTGDESSLHEYYEDLKHKTLLALAREDGLISTQNGLLNQNVLDSIYAPFETDHLDDLVDWPCAEFVSDGGAGERDHHEMLEINTVVNAYHYRNLCLMAKISRVLGKKDDEKFFHERSQLVYQSFNKLFFDDRRQIYIDGNGAAHSSLHSNMFALAFGLVPSENISSVMEFIQSRGMACSVYGAQHLLNGLYMAGYDSYALELMSATTDRSWYNMLRVGSTVTLEAWDWKYKNNLDWNHAWGAAPANIIPRLLAGVQPLKPGFEQILIKPQFGDLKFFKITVPTIRGAVKMRLQIQGQRLKLNITVPGNAYAKIDLSGIFSCISELKLNGETIASDKHSFEVTSGQYSINADGVLKNSQ